MSGIPFYITWIIKGTALCAFVVLKNSFLDMSEIHFNLQTRFTEEITCSY